MLSNMHSLEPLARLTLAVLLAAALNAAGAREVYKYRMPDGRILYSGEVMTQGKLLEVLPPPPASPKLIESEQRAKLLREQALERAIVKRLDTMDAVEAEIKAATLALEAAKAAAAAGLEPLAGERLSLAGKPGRTRMSDDYWERQRHLGRTLDAARERLDAAYLARNALR